MVLLYFEAAALITTLVLLGQMLEAKARGRTGAAIKALALNSDLLNDHHRVEEAEGIEPTESRLRPDTVSLVTILRLRSNLLVWCSRRFKQPKQTSALRLAKKGAHAWFR